MNDGFTGSRPIGEVEDTGRNILSLFLAYLIVYTSRIVSRPCVHELFIMNDINANPTLRNTVV